MSTNRTLPRRGGGFALLLFLILNTAMAWLRQEKPTASLSSQHVISYKPYPAYCSNPPAMTHRAIPPLSETSLQSHPNIRLLQSHVLIRHGARTPDNPSMCWTSYDETWDCEVTTLMTPHDNDPSGVFSEGQFLFEKRYDALQSPLTNTLGGTCLTGQLIKKGYEQELANGQHLRYAYVEGEDYRKLFQNASYDTGRPYEDSTRFRGDDQQRILLSGQTLIRALFDVTRDTVVPFHTAELGMDPIYTNKNICPRLRDLEQEAVESHEFMARNSSAQAKRLDRLLDMTESDWEHILDCLMTQKCNDRPLHPRYDDFVSDKVESVFNDIVAHHTWQRTFHYRYNDAAYSKLAMGPLWAEIMSTLKVTLDTRVQSLEDMKARNIPLLLLYTGHDSTLMPFLSTFGNGVWDGKWTPYGSTVIIESYNVGQVEDDFPSGKAFRILFNGKLLTPKICNAELCDLDILLRMVRPFATWDRWCESRSNDEIDMTDDKFVADEQVIEYVPSTTTREMSVASLIGIGFGFSLVACVATLLVITRTRLGRSLLSATNMRYEPVDQV